ncbi:MAG TPA: SDR family oxidoreductase [Anaeromyxobacter sp.]|nr:SDR family oxidoreductase [Anaeromyxobacter sp.]
MAILYRLRLMAAKAVGLGRRLESALIGPTATQRMLSRLGYDHRSLVGKRILVTGSTRGIGLATAAEFAHRGALVAIHGRRVEAAQGVAAALSREYGSRVAAVGGDLAAMDTGRELVEAAARVLGGIDVIVNNAAIHDPVRKPIWATSTEEFERTLRVNLIAPFEVAGAAIRLMLKQRTGGRIINVSSIAADPAHVSPDGIASYGISKRALEALSAFFAAEVGGIDVTVVRLTAIATDMTKALFPWDARWQMLPAQSAAQAIAYLATAPSEAVHGKVFDQVELLSEMATALDVPNVADQVGSEGTKQ